MGPGLVCHGVRPGEEFDEGKGAGFEIGGPVPGFVIEALGLAEGEGCGDGGEVGEVDLPRKDIYCGCGRVGRGGESAGREGEGKQMEDVETEKGMEHLMMGVLEGLRMDRQCCGVGKVRAEGLISWLIGKYSNTVYLILFVIVAQ